MKCKKSLEREMWVDNVKVVACLLVVVGHFFQSMVKANLIVESNLYKWFNDTIYLFHVPLFFICSGYLYQRNSNVNTFIKWKENIIKKIIELGIPYFTFSILSCLFKYIGGDSTHYQVEGMIESLFIFPLSPYWYLYALFFVFCVTPTITKRKNIYIYLGIALIFRIYLATIGECRIYAILMILSNEIWFVLGMFLHVIDFKRLLKKTNGLLLGILMCFIFIIISIIMSVYETNSELLDLGVGVIACFAIVILADTIPQSHLSKMIIVKVSEYTFPIFLMHTIIAAFMRMILLRLGSENVALHIIMGLGASVLGPVIITKIIKKYKWVEFLLYPRKYVKIRM